jgi:hypothetical protein
MRKWNEAGRLGFALIFFAGGIVNAAIVTHNPDIYSAFAQFSFLPVYQYIWSVFVIPKIQSMVYLVALFEIIIALLLVQNGQAVRIGLFIGGLFMMSLFPFWWAGGSLFNLVFAGLLFTLSTFRYPFSAIELLKRRDIVK